MLPVDAPGSYLRCNSLCEKEVIRDVMEVTPRLFLILLDMCLKVPDRSEFIVLRRTISYIELFHDFPQFLSNPGVY
jgi:hypothetical protein